jgi:DNA-binding NarL/FixJ family response regulator
VRAAAAVQGEVAEFGQRAELDVLAERVERLEQRLAALEQPAPPPLLFDPLRRLTDSERRIAELVAKGHTNHEVARRLCFSPKTGEWNLSKVYKKLHVVSRTELAAKLAKR